MKAFKLIFQVSISRLTGRSVAEAAIRPRQDSQTGRQTTCYFKLMNSFFVVAFSLDSFYGKKMQKLIR